MKQMKKREGLKKKKSNNNYLWEILDDIKIYKKGNLLDNPRYEKEFNPFIALRALAMDSDLTEIVNVINPVMGNLSKKQMYSLLIKLIPVTEKRVRWIKNVKDDNKDLEAVMKYFDCNRREALLYFNANDEKWLEEIKDDFGGLH
jgi:hypothetical protein